MDVLSADQIRAIRALLGWTQKDLAKQSGVPLWTVSRIELGKVKSRSRKEELAVISSTLERAQTAFTKENKFAAISPAQIRAARALLDWVRLDLAERIGVSKTTILRIELRQIRPKPNLIAAIRSTLELAGIIFVDADNWHGPGVRLREPEK